MSARDLLYLDSLIDAADTIRSFVATRDGGQFFSERLVQDAVLRNSEILREAANSRAQSAPRSKRTHRRAMIDVSVPAPPAMMLPATVG